MTDYKDKGLIKVNDFWVRVQLERNIWCLYKVPKGKEDNYIPVPADLLFKAPLIKYLSAKAVANCWAKL
jgi:hypothetical protein